MDKLAFCCLLLIGSLSPLQSLPVTDSRDESLQLPAPQEEGQVLAELLGRAASLLQALLEVLGAERHHGAKEAEPTTEVPNPSGDLRKTFSGQDPNIVLSHLLARARKHKQHGTPSECFWKYCV
uniref:Urotensin-2 n=1 Tax=Castor canadensis TaxID=51338 RepID=A0A8C0WPN4_CASCN